MRLPYRITLQLSAVLLVIFAAWATLFYFILIDEIDDDIDDTLQHYAGLLITRKLTGEPLPEQHTGVDNSYYDIVEVAAQYADRMPAKRFADETAYLPSEGETELVRAYRTVFKDRDNRYYELTVMVPAIERDDLKETVLFWIVLLYVVLLTVIVAVSLAIQRRSFKPLYAMLDWLKNTSPDRPAPPIDTPTDVPEFSRLADALQQSARRNSKIYEEQQLFIGHAAHELQTPVAIARNRLELLAEDADLTETQLTQLIKARQALDKLSKLNRTLLLLTRIENEQYAESSTIDVDALVGSLVADFDEAYSHLHIRTSIKQYAPLCFEINETLASLLFSNLLKNAYLHNNEGGEVVVATRADGIRISNTAVHGALNPDYIFRRFYRDGRHEDSTGLGLPLVQSICRRYGMAIIYTYGDGMHHFDLAKNR